MDASKVLYKAGTFYPVINSDLDKAPRVVRRAAAAIFSGAGCTVYQLYRFTAWRFGAKVTLAKSLQILAHMSKKDAPVNSVVPMTSFSGSPKKPRRELQTFSTCATIIVASDQPKEKKHAY